MRTHLPREVGVTRQVYAVLPKPIFQYVETEKIIPRRRLGGEGVIEPTAISSSAAAVPMTEMTWTTCELTESKDLPASAAGGGLFKLWKKKTGTSCDGWTRRVT